MLSEGAMITPSIRLLRPLGSGGMGSVWVAAHLTLRTEVVVKLMRPELARDADHTARFSREAAAAANVKSPHVVQIFDHGLAPDGAPFIVMELLEGEDLAGPLGRGPLPPKEAVAVVSQVCKALARAHERGIVHRDIKPNNVFLCQVGGGETFVKLLDFGIAKASGALQHGLDTTSTGAIMGTPYYMSPEQALGSKGVDLRTDLWAVGVMAFEMLTGRKPFAGETVGALAVAICSAPMPVPSSFHPALPPAIDAWFARACARRADDRFASARELADAFEAAAGGATPLALAATVPSVPSQELPALAGLGSTTHAPTSLAPGASTAGVARRSSAAVVLLVGVIALVAGVGVTLVFVVKPRGAPAVSPGESAAEPAGSASAAAPPAPVESAVAASGPSASASPEPAPGASAASLVTRPTTPRPRATGAPPGKAAPSAAVFAPAKPSATHPPKAAPAASFDRNSID